MKPSQGDRTLRPVLIVTAAYCTLVAVAAVVVGRAIAHADRREPLVPQLDVPLWRGTDLKGARCSGCPDCLPIASDLPDDRDGHLSGAILGLAYAVDGTTARYWLAVCAR